MTTIEPRDLVPGDSGASYSPEGKLTLDGKDVSTTENETLIGSSVL